MFIVEGPDGAGKSTLVEQLADELDLEIGERATTNRDKLYEVTRQDTYTALGLAVTAHEKPKIWDRLFFSEMVYAPVIDRACEFSFEEQVFAKRVIGALGTPIISCLPPWEAVLHNVEGTHQMQGVSENLKNIYVAYKTIFQNMPWVIYYDYTGEQSDPGFKSYQELVDSCKHYLSHRENRSW